MSWNSGKRIVGIVGVNSREYIDQVFSVLNAGDIAVTLRNADDCERIDAAGVGTVKEPGDTAGWIDLPAYTLPADDRFVQLLFTSGTEGAPKGILLTARNLQDTTDRIVDVMAIDRTIREYVGIPVYFSFGFGRVRVLSQVGGACYLPPKGFSPLEVASMLEDGQINALSAVPTLLRLLLQERERFSQCGRNLRWLEIGSQYMSGEEKAALQALFPKARIVQHYGLTEASRSTFLKVHEADRDSLDSVGQCYGSSEYRLTDEGRIQVRGAHVAGAALIDGTVTPLLDSEGWLTTSDLGHVAGDCLYFDGRGDDLINCGGVKLSPDALGEQIHRALGQSDVVGIAGIPDPLRGDGLLVAYRRNSPAELATIRRCTESALNASRISLRSATVYFAVDELPVTETGKLQRKRLRQAYLDSVAVSPPPDDGFNAGVPAGGDRASMQTMLVAIWEETLNIRPISVHDSFVDLGGDSLTAIRMGVRMEKSGIPRHICQQILQGKTIAEIVDDVKGAGKSSAKALTAKSIDVTRGLLVLAVIAAHWMPGVVQHLPAGLQVFDRFLAPFYTAGTPGFAIIFGVGVGFFHLHRFLHHPDAVSQLVRKNGAILFGGLACLAGVRVLSYVAQGLPVTPLVVTNAFWSVITYYLLAVLSLPLWLRLLAHYPRPIVPALLFSAALFGAHMIIVGIVAPQPSDNALLQLLVLIGTAKYNYCEMSAGAMAGAAIGIWYRARLAEGLGIEPLLPVGLLAIAFSIVLSQEAGGLDLWFTWPKPVYLWTWCFYWGVVVLLIHWMHRVLAAKPLNVGAEWLVNVLATIGIMAFPMFIGHEMVLPLRDLLAGLGMSASLPVAMVLFVGPAVYFMVKLYRLYYARADQTPSYNIEVQIKS